MSAAERVHVHRAAARLAGREMRRRPWRTTLVVLLVALPVAAMVLAAALLHTSSPPFDVEDQSAFGLADLTVTEGFGPGPLVVEDLEQARRRILAAVPGARTAVVEEANGSLQGPFGPPRSVRLVGPEDDPMVATRTTVRRGRVPKGPGQVAVSPRLARAWQVEIGGTLDLPQLGLHATVVGLAHPLAGARSETLYVGAMPKIATEQRSRSLFADLPGDTKSVHEAVARITAGGQVSVPQRNLAGLIGPERARSAASSSDAGVRWSTVVGALALAVFGLVIAAAFAVGARRQLRTLGILASNGASPAALRAVVIWQGAWAGLLGAVGGLVLAGLGLVAAWPSHDRFLSYEPRWFTVRLTDLGPIVGLGVLTALLASYQPARTVSRLSILTSLAGRRPLAPVRRRVVLLGLAVMAVGTAFLGVATVGAEGSAGGEGGGSDNLWVGIAVLGGLGLLFGSSAVAPALVGVFDPLARRFRGSPMLALRSLARQAARSGAVVAAVCAAAALAVAASALLVSVTDDSQTYVPANVVLLQGFSFAEPTIVSEPPPSSGPGPGATVSVPAPRRPEAVAEADLAAVVAAIPSARRTEVASPYGFLVATPEVLDIFDVDAVTRRLLDEHGAVRPGGGERYHGQIARSSPPPADALGASSLDAQVQALSDGAVTAPTSRYGFVNQTTLISVERAAGQQLSTAHPAVAFVSDRPLTARQRSVLNDLASYRQASLLRLASSPPPAGAVGGSTLQVLFAAQEVSRLVIYAMFDGLALLFTSFVILVGLALAAAETREEVEVLIAVGASPSLLRRLAAAKAALLAGAGVALAVPTGLLPVWVVRNASNGSSRFLVPWASLGLLVVVLPAAVALLAMAGSAVAARFRPITAGAISAD